MKGTVLLVDDDPEVIRTFTTWLQLSGYSVRAAADGEAALLQMDGVDAIILDVHMPILDGLGFLRRVRRDDGQVPIAMVTGDYLIGDDTLNAFRQLRAEVMFKPLWVDDLVALATSMMERRAAV